MYDNFNDDIKKILKKKPYYFTFNIYISWEDKFDFEKIIKRYRQNNDSKAKTIINILKEYDQIKERIKTKHE